MAMKMGKDLFDYINSLRNPNAKQTMKRRVQEYQANPDIVGKFESVMDRYFFVVFAADWNAECWAQLPGLAKLLISANNNNFLVKVVDFDQNRDIAEEMQVMRIPTIIVHDKSWREIGRFVEKPQHGATLEEELWQIISRNARAS